MSASSTDESGGFFAYYRVYARSGIHGASAAALTAFGLIATYTGNNVFILLAIAVYVLPPIFLYLTAEGENVPSVVGDDITDTGERDSNEVEETGDHRGDSTADSAFESGDRTGTTHETGTEPESAAGNRDPTAEPDATAVATADHPSELSEKQSELSEEDETDRYNESASAGGAPESDFETAETESDTSDAGSTPPEDDAERRFDTETSVGDEPASGVAGREPSGDTDASEETEPAESAVEAVGADDADTADIEPGWHETDTPTEESLLDVVATRDGAFAVGEAGVVLARDGDGWEVALEDGPTANAKPLRGVDATPDEGAVWFAGDSGVLGRYTDGRLTDHSAPEDQTSTWEDVAVTGEAGNERIHLVNGSGELLRGEYDGGAIEWSEIEKPGSGSSIAAVEFVGEDRGHFVDTNQSVYETTNGGESYEEIGIEGANTAFTDVAATDSTVVVSGDDGSVFRYDGAVWTRLHPSESTLSAVDLVDGAGLAAGDAGEVFELADDSWESAEIPTDDDLTGVSLGETGHGIAVGMDGTVIERRQ